MPPEQAAGAPVDARADVYALGAILYDVLSGRPPHHGASGDEVLALAREGAVRPVRQVAPAVPPDLAAIVDQAMARQPSERYPTAGALGEDLRRFLEGQLVRAHHYPALTLLRRWLQRHRTAVTATAALMVVLAGSGLAALGRIVRERNTPVLIQAERSLHDEPTASLAWLKLHRPSGSATLLHGQRAARAEATALASADQGRHLVASGPYHLRVWAPRPPRPDILLGHRDRITTLGFSADGRQLVSGSRDGTAVVWDQAAGSHWTSPPEEAWTTAVGLLDRTRLLIGTRQGHLSLREVGSGRTLPGLGAAALAVAPYPSVRVHRGRQRLAGESRQAAAPGHRPRIRIDRRLRSRSLCGARIDSPPLDLSLAVAVREANPVLHCPALALAGGHLVQASRHRQAVGELPFRRVRPRRRDSQVATALIDDRRAVRETLLLSARESQGAGAGQPQADQESEQRNPLPESGPGRLPGNLDRHPLHRRHRGLGRGGVAHGGDRLLRRSGNQGGELLVQGLVMTKHHQQQPQRVGGTQFQGIAHPVQLLPFPVGGLTTEQQRKVAVELTHGVTPPSPRGASTCIRLSSARAPCDLRTAAPRGTSRSSTARGS
jgi:hypothetical protein